MKHAPISKPLAFSQAQINAALKAAPDKIEDPETPYDPNDAGAVDAYWSSAELRLPGQRGKQKAAAKVAVSIRLSPQVVDHFKRDGEGWQTRINDALERLVEQATNKAA